jgi:hypothetical protein
MTGISIEFRCRCNTGIVSKGRLLAVGALGHDNSHPALLYSGCADLSISAAHLSAAQISAAYGCGGLCAPIGNDLERDNDESPDRPPGELMEHTNLRHERGASVLYLGTEAPQSFLMMWTPRGRTPW